MAIAFGCLSESNRKKRERGSECSAVSDVAIPKKHRRDSMRKTMFCDEVQKTETAADLGGRKEQVRRGVVHYSAEYYDDILVALGRDPTPSDNVLVASGIVLTFNEFVELEGKALQLAFPIIMLSTS